MVAFVEIVGFCKWVVSGPKEIRGSNEPNWVTCIGCQTEDGKQHPRIFMQEPIGCMCQYSEKAGNLPHLITTTLCEWQIASPRSLPPSRGL